MTTTVYPAPPTILQFFDNAGRPAAGGSILTQVGGVNYPTYQDSAGSTPLPNPIPLNSRGEISTASGASAQLFLAAGQAYTFTLYDASGNQLNTPAYVAPGITSTAISASSGSSLVGFIEGYSGAVGRTVQDKLREAPVSLYDFGGTFQGDCIAAMNLALASGASVIQVPDGVTLGQHTITSPNITILGGKNVTFSPSVNAAGFIVGSSGRVTISGFVNAVLAPYPDVGGVIANGHVFVSLATGAVIDELIILNNSLSGGRIGISAGFENGRMLNKHCVIMGNVCSNQNGGQGGEGYGIHYANENDTGKVYIADNVVVEAGRHSFYIARNVGAPVTLIGNKALRHRQNSTTQGTNVRPAFAIFRSSNVNGYGNQVDGFFDGALMISEETEIVTSPLNADNVRMYGMIIRNPNNVAAAVWTGYTDPSPTATVNGVLLDGLVFDSSLAGSQVFQFSWGRGIKIRDWNIIYRNVTAGSRMFLFQGDTTADSAGVAVEDVNIHLLNCTGSFSIMRPIAPFATSTMALRVRDIKVISNTGGATVNDWEPSVTVTNPNIDVFGFSFPSAASVSPLQTQFPSGIQTLTGSGTWDPPSLAPASRALFNVTVTGANMGDFAIASLGESLAGLSVTASVEALNTVTVCLTNTSAGTVDLASTTVRALVIQRQ